MDCLDKTLKLLSLMSASPAQRRRCSELLSQEWHKRGDVSEILEQLTHKSSERDKAKGILDRCMRSDISVTPIGGDSYPDGLYRLKTPPLLLFSRGSELLSRVTHRVSVVGSRRADQDGIDLTKYFVSALSPCGITIVSGLAYGIDAASHWAALQQGKGSCATEAVLASGVDQIYPRANERLAEEVLEQGGVILSEYPPGTTPRRHSFLERNRIIAALSRAVIVIQASERSGALSTASFAAEMGIDVFCPPGRIGDELYAGNHQLINTGAFLLGSADQLLKHLELEEIERVNCR